MQVLTGRHISVIGSPRRAVSTQELLDIPCDLILLLSGPCDSAYQRFRLIPLLQDKLKVSY
jgi:hypothetical protein